MKIENAFDDLVLTIRESAVYKNYSHLLKQVERNADINKAISDIKRCQRKMVKQEHVYKKDIKQLEEVLEEKKKKLYSIPLYQDYIEASDALNDMLKQVKNRLQTYINGLDI